MNYPLLITLTCSIGLILQRYILINKQIEILKATTSAIKNDNHTKFKFSVNDYKYAEGNKITNCLTTETHIEAKPFPKA